MKLKKIFALGLGLCASVCAAVAIADLSLGVSAETVALSETDLQIDGGVLKGLSEAGKQKEAEAEYISITVPSIVTAIGENAFSEDRKLKSINFDEATSLTTIGDGAFYSCSSLEELNLPESVETINRRAFRGCFSLSEITIPQNVQNIGQEAFYSCTGIDTINYYAASASVYANAFAWPQEAYSSSALSPVTVNIGSPDHTITKLPSGLFCDSDDETVTGIVSGHRAIAKVNFNHVVLADGVGDEGWGYNLFMGCTSLKEVTFEDCTIPDINLGAFEGCSSLVKVEGLENIGLKTIHERAFKDCTSLPRIIIGSTVGDIKDQAFFNCAKLVEVVDLSPTINIQREQTENGYVAYYALAVYDSDTTKIETDADGYEFITVDDGSQAGTYILGYTGEGRQLTLPDSSPSGKSVSRIYQRAFYLNTNITHISVNDTSNIIVIGESAFAGCSSLVSVELPEKLVEAGGNLLQDCTTLSSVTFKGTQLTALPNAAFKNCIALESIELKNLTSIGYEAFSGCTSLDSITFTGDKLSRIDGYAFANCTSLEVITLPQTLQNVGAGAFDGCGSLVTVYLPKDEHGATDKIVNYGQRAFDGCSSELVLVSTDKDQYTADKAKSNLSAYSDKLTYEVEIKAYYHDGVAVDDLHTLYKLFGRDSGYTKSDDKWTNTNSLPLQTGYSRSVWYADSSKSDELTAEEFTQKLKADGVASIDIYANYYTKPKLTAYDATFSEGMNYDVDDVLNHCFRLDGNAITGGQTSVGEMYQFSVIEHTLVNGEPDEDFSSSYVTEAGTYVLEVKLKENYGEWTENQNVKFTVKPKEVDISDKITWKTVGGDLLLDSDDKLYFYKNTDTPYDKAQDGLGDPTKTLTVLNSYMVYTGTEIKIELGWSGTQYGEVVEGSYSGNAATQAGTHTATVNVKPNNNYKFIFRWNATLANSLDKQGLDISISDSMATITKVWYIVLTDANYLVTDGGGALYNIDTTWTYMDAEPDLPQAPHLSENDAQRAELLTFSLVYDNGVGQEQIADKVALESDSKFSEYINSSMPAGDYELTFFIADSDKDGTTITGDPSGIKFNFTVQTKTVLGEWKSAASALLKDDNGFINHASAAKFIDVSSLSVFTAKTQTEPVGIWEDYPQFYEPFKIKYFVKSGDKVNFINDPLPDAYYAATEFSGSEPTAPCAIPQSIGTYTVFYEISAPNYGEKITGIYELNLCYELQKPEKFTVDFTGGSVIDRVLMELKERLDSVHLDAYDVFTLREEDRHNTPASLFGSNADPYTSPGEHHVFVLIKDSMSKFISWDKSIPATDFSSAFINIGGREVLRTQFLKVVFEITASRNEEITPLSVNSWEYGEFSLTKNKPNWELRFVNNYDNFKFTLTSKTNDSEVYTLYGDNRQLGVNEVGFDKAPAGEYILKGEAPGDSKLGINAFTATCNTVRVLKATPKFVTLPHIDSWNYDSYSADKVSSIVYTLSGRGSDIIDKIKVSYCTAAEYVKINPTYYEDISKLLYKGKLPVGSYYAVLTLDETDNFAAWSYGVRFQVTGESHDWTYGDFARLGGIDALFDKSVYGNPSDVTILYKTNSVLDNKWVSSIEDLNGYDKFAKELNVGNYEFRVLVLGAEVARDTFNVKKASNGWTETPSIIGWEKGAYSSDNKPKAQAEFGNSDITYIVTDSNGRQYSVNDLNKLGVGSYTLTVNVKDSENFEGLTTVVYFNVTESSVGITGIMWAMIVFAIIAVALAVTGIVILVLNSKRADAQFRKTVKNELRRK